MIRLKNLLNEEYSDTYFESFSAIAEYVLRTVKKKGYEVDEDEWWSKVSLGGRYTKSRPSKGRHIVLQFHY